MRNEASRDILGRFFLRKERFEVFVGVFREDLVDYGAGFGEGGGAIICFYGGCFERVEEGL